MTEAFIVQREMQIAAPPATVFAFLTDPQKIVSWMGLEAETELHPGGLYLLKGVAGDRTKAARGAFREVVPVRCAETRRKIAANFRRHGFDTLDLSNDELAKQHIRYMVGGHSPLAHDELLYRFEFPERPGALMKFLSSMSPNWNISLFHYRNQGADTSNILVGIQVPKNEKRAFRSFLSTLGYVHWDETDNPVYKLFLS